MNVGREKILLEVVKDIVETTYPRYSDKFIKENIIEYLTLQQNKKDYELTNAEELRLIELNNYFFGNSEGIISSDSASSIVDMYKATFSEVEEILKKNNLFGPELISLLSNILNIHTVEGQDKNKLTADYLNQVIIPAMIGKKINSSSSDVNITKSKSIDIDFDKEDKPEEKQPNTKQPSLLVSDTSERDQTKDLAKLTANIAANKNKADIRQQQEAEERKEAREAKKIRDSEAKEAKAKKETEANEAKAKKETEAKEAKANSKDKGKSKGKKTEQTEETEETESSPLNLLSSDEIVENKFKIDYKIAKNIITTTKKGDYDDYLLKQLDIQKFIHFLDNYDELNIKLIMLNLHYLIKYNLYDKINNNDSSDQSDSLLRVQTNADKYSYSYNLYDEILNILKIYNDELIYFNIFNLNEKINELEKNIKAINELKTKKDELKTTDSNTNLQKLKLNSEIEKILNQNKKICEFIDSIFQLRLFQKNNLKAEFKSKYKYILITNIYIILETYNNLDSLKTNTESIKDKNLNIFIEYIKNLLKTFEDSNLEIDLQLTPKVKNNDYANLALIITQKEKISKFKDGEIKQALYSDNSIKGGNIHNENFISLIDVYKLYYNCISFKDGHLIFTSILNINEKYIIYLFYLFFNAYAYYFKDDINKHQLIKQLKNIIDDNKYTEAILKSISKLLNDIFTILFQLFNEYVKDFYETDTIIKNYYTDKKQILYYLFINFLYPFYINIPDDDLKISLNINGTIIKISKKHNEILYEINEILYDVNFITYIYNYLLNKLTVKLLNINDYLKSEISYLFNFIYKFTSHKYKITLNSLYEINAYLITCLLTSSEPIELTINDNIYKFPSSLTNIIKNHPYIIEYDNKINVKITTSKIQEDLYNCILNEKNVKQILLILTEDFSYLNLNLNKICKFKFYLNKEIIDIINNKGIDDYLLIDYNAYNFSLDTHYKPHLQLFNVVINGKYYKLLFSINYAIYLCASLYKNISLYNYSTLLYLFIYIKHQIEHKTKEYLEILNYDGSNYILNKYKNIFLDNNLLNFFKIVIISMQIELSKKYDLNSFIYYLLNFNQNKYINKLKSKIHININFITEIFKDKQNEIDINFYTTLLNLSIILYEICIVNNINKKRDVIQFMYNFFIPILKELYKYRQHITIEKLEKYVIDIRAIELSNMICKKSLIGGGNEISESTSELNTEINKNNSNELNTEPENLKIDDIDKISKKIEFLTLFKKNFDELETIEKLKVRLQEKLMNYFSIPKHTDDNKTEGYITQKDYTDILPNINNPNFLSKIANLSSAIETNKSEIGKERTKYTNEANKKTNKLKEDLKLLKIFINLLESNKSNPIINKILIEIEGEKFIDEVKDYIVEYDSVYDKYMEFLQDGIDKYESLKDSIKKLEEAYKNLNIPKKGGYKEYEAIIGGDANIKDLQNKKIEKFFTSTDDKKNKKEKTATKIDNLIKNVKKIKSTNVISKDIDNSVSSNKIINNNQNSDTDQNLFEKMLNTYNSDLASSIPEIANNKFYDDVLDNNLDPEIELALIFSDKIIFIVIISIITLSSLYMTYYFIDTNLINGIIDALYYYIVCYLIIFTIILVIINIDLFKLRVLINYFNMHINSSNIYTHYILQIMISYIIYLLIINLNTDPDPTRLSKNQKFKLKNKLNIITVIVLIFIVMFVLIL